MRRQIVLVLAGLVACAGFPAPGFAANRFFISSQTLTTGTTGNTVPIRADMDQDVYAFSVSLQYDAAKLRIAAVNLSAAVSALSPEFDDGLISTSPGRVFHGVVLDMSDPITNMISADTNVVLLELAVDVVATAASTTVLDLVNIPGDLPRLNVMTDGNGDSVSPAPTLVDGTITIQKPPPGPPVIQSLASNRGTVGSEFSVVGDNFDSAGLAVEVCGMTAAFALQADQRTLLVTAPFCGTTGWATVEVCTSGGCDTEANGFNYVSAPAITSVTGNSGEAGDVFTVVADNVDIGITSVKVCTKAATYTLAVDKRTLTVTAPSCGTYGWAALEVCTDAGCDTEAQGFNYLSPGAPNITSLENNEGDAGDDFRIIGLNFDQPNLSVQVCGTNAAFSLDAGKTTITVTAPYCGSGGWAPVEVCTDGGCDTEAQGFLYPPDETPFIRGNANNDSTVDISDAVGILNDLFLGIPSTAPCRDALDTNDSGAVDISDAVYLLSFLFQGGAKVKEPYPAAGTDPTTDPLPDC
jgi:hypothetical protein